MVGLLTSSPFFGANQQDQQKRLFQPLSIGADVLTGWYIAKATASAASSLGPQLSGASTKKDVVDIAAPWDTDAKPSPSEDLKRRALASGVFLDLETYDGYSDTKASLDEKQLFALHQAFKKLNAVAAEASERTTTEERRKFLDRRFQEGMAQVNDFLAKAKFEGVGVAARDLEQYITGSMAITRPSENYSTGVLHDGPYDAEVDSFLGNRAFSMTVRKNGVDTQIDFDLNEMGATTRNLDNVAAYINGKLEAEGLATRFKRVKIGEENEDGIVEGNRFGYEIRGIITEKLTFSAPASATGAVYLAGTSGRSNEELETHAAGQITKISDLDAAAPLLGRSVRFETLEDEDGEWVDHSGLKISAAKAAPDGGFYALATTGASVDGGPVLRGEEDVVLARFDSTGQVMWTRALGAADEAEGRTLSVGADGSVVVGGTISGDFGETVDIGGKDAFVTRFDADGVQDWTRRFGGLGDDAVDSVTVGDDGTVYVAGRVRGSLGEQAYAGGNDAYVRAIDSVGRTLWTREFGTAGDDVASAVTLADDGSLLVGSVEDGLGFVRKYSTADGTSPATWEHALGDLDSGFINAIHADATGIYVAGAGREGMTLAGSPVAHSGARDAFVVALDDGASPTVRFETFLGAAEEDVARDIVVADGSVYVAGYTDGELPGGAVKEGGRNGFAAKLDATTGALDWTQQVTGRGGWSEGAALVYDAGGSSDLDVFGLPSGSLFYEDDRSIATRTSARAGDAFYISVDGGAKRRIAIDEDDTLRALTFTLKSILLLDGDARVQRTSEGDVLRIDPKPGVKIELFAGREGYDLLEALGLEEGVVTKPAEDTDEDEAIKTFGLSLPKEMSLLSRTDAEAALKAMDQAMSNVRGAHRHLTRDPELEALLKKQNAAKGPVPAHLTAQIANYESALARLTGGF